MMKKYALDLDDAHAGWIAAPDGFFDVVPWLRERRGAVLIEPAAAFWPWLQGSLDGEPREAAIVAFDDEGREVERLVVADPWISELGMPRLGAARGGAGALWLQIEASAAEMRTGGQTTVSAREGGAAVVACRLYLPGQEAPLQVEAIGPLTLTSDRRGSLQRLAMTVTGAPQPGEAEALVGGDGALEYIDGRSTAMTRVKFRVAGIDVEAATAEPTGAPRARLTLACRGLQLEERRDGDASA